MGISECDPTSAASPDESATIAPATLNIHHACHEED